ncbi:hypothetical protein MNBD_GAMMA01-1588, partial [hydrothermal vent metagenome]
SADGFYCWIFGGVYQLSIGIAGNANDPNNWYQDLGEAYLETFGNQQSDAGVFVKDMDCAGQQMADWLGERYDGNYDVGEMFGYSWSPTGYPSNLQPALATIVDSNYPNANLGWQRLINRTGFPDYSSSPQFAVTPRSMNAEFSSYNPNSDIENTMIAQVLDALRKLEKTLITNKVTTFFSSFLCTSVTCTLNRISISGFGYNKNTFKNISDNIPSIANNPSFDNVTDGDNIDSITDPSASSTKDKS